MSSGIPKVVDSLLGLFGIKTIRGSGNLITESRSVSDFDRVDLSGRGQVVITQGGEESLVVETDDNVMPYVRTVVKSGTLDLGFDSKYKNISPTHIQFTLGVKDLSGIKISGSGDITADSLDTERLEVKVSGSGNMGIDSLTTKSIKARISGSGNVDLAGEATEQGIGISGSGKYRAQDLRSETAKVKIGGSGSSTVWVTESLNARISGSGAVYYYGKPKVKSKISGSGKIKGRGEH